MRKGYDSAVTSREEDHLNRWPLAKEIYGIAITSPREWSVRIGIYGEWGSGKTTILNFISEMARHDNNIVVHFNPWEYTSRETLWKAFVLKVYEELSKQLSDVRGIKKAQAKKWGKKLGSDVGKLLSIAAGAVNDKAGEVVDVGLDLVKSFLVFGKDDLDELGDILGERKLFVLIDDLDRTNPGLVPEILFVLKEIMDIPGYAFVSAFDPAVVGEVLGKYHPGFGNGLKFLKKVIDYPRWIPPPTDKGMQALARADMVRYCPYVPLSAMDDNLPHLPKNPRILRQYIRLLAFLKPQVERHYENELNWPVILAANLIKVLYPQMAQRLFDDDAIWSDINSSMIIDVKKGPEEDNIGAILSKHLTNVTQSLNFALDMNDSTRILQILRLIAKSSSPFWGGARAILYQIRVAEAPSAVTWKEYDTFISDWKTHHSAKQIGEWISTHATTVGCEYNEVYRELLDALIRHRINALDQAGDEILKTDMKSQLIVADQLLTILEQLVFDCGGLKSEGKLFGEEQIKNMFTSFMKYIGWVSSAEYKKLRHREKEFLERIVHDWAGDITPLLNILQPYSDIPEGFRDEPEKILYKELGEKALRKLAEKVLRRFQEKDFVKYIRRPNEEHDAVRHILFQVDGPLWKGLRKEMICMLTKAATDINIQLNAYEFLYMFEYKCRREPDFEDTKALKDLLGNKRICNALWKAAIATRLNPRYVGGLQYFPNRIKDLGIMLKMPVWWFRELKSLGIKK